VTAEQQAAFVARFEDAWADPRGGERLLPLLHPEGRLVQPIEGELRGHAEVTRMWERTFGLIPDLRGELVRWAGSEDLLVIELRLHGTLPGGRPIEWITADHIRLDDDGLVTERIAHFDPLPLVTAVLRTPAAWPAFVRGNLARLRRADVGSLSPHIRGLESPGPD
jgi:hypothetical protein